MRIVTLTKSYPTPEDPVEGSFIASRMAAVAKRESVRVLHAVRVGRRLPPDDDAAVPPVRRVRYRYVPGVLKGLDHRLLEASVGPTLAAWRARGELDLLDAHFGYPEGAAAVRIGRRLGVPVSITLRGTEEDFLGRGARGREMARAIREADRVIAVSRSLAGLAAACGADARRVRVIENGVDADAFSPGDRNAARRRLGLPDSGPLVLSVGLLVPRKGHHRLVGMLPGLLARRPDLRLAIVGGGPMAGRLGRLARRLGVADRVRLAGPQDRERLPDWYRAADVFALASRREGFANVLLEALASGLPVVTTDAGGAREAIPDDRAGLVVPVGDDAAFAAALDRALGRSWDRRRARALARARSWSAVGARVALAFRELLVHA